MSFIRSCLDDISQMLIHPLKKEKAAVKSTLSLRCDHGNEDDNPSAPYTPVSKSSLTPVSHNEDSWRTPPVNARCHQDRQCPGAPRKSIRFVHRNQDSDFQPRKLDFSGNNC